MTIEDFTRRLGASLALSGVFLLVTAFVCWISIGDGDTVVHSIHNVAGFVLAAFGTVFVAVGVALAAVVPPAERRRPGPRSTLR